MARRCPLTLAIWWAVLASYRDSCKTITLMMTSSATAAAINGFRVQRQPSVEKKQDARCCARSV